GCIRESDLKLAVTIQKERPTEKIGNILVEIHAVSEERLVEVLAIQLGIERLDPRATPPDPQLWQDIKWFRATELVPVERHGTAVAIAFADPLNKKQLEAAQKVFGRDIIVGIAGRTEIQEAIDRHTSHKPKAFALVEHVVVDTVDQMLRDAIL